LDDDCAFFDDFHVVFGEEGGAVVVAEFADGEKGASGETIQYVSFACSGG
jgi:hypothetical protein